MPKAGELPIDVDPATLIASLDDADYIRSIIRDLDNEDEDE